MAFGVFIETRLSNRIHFCTECGEIIGPGDEYKREGISPWAFVDKDEEGNLINLGDGVWIIFKQCYDCLGAR